MLQYKCAVGDSFFPFLRPGVGKRGSKHARKEEECRGKREREREKRLSPPSAFFFLFEFPIGGKPSLEGKKRKKKKGTILL